MDERLNHRPLAIQNICRNLKARDSLSPQEQELIASLPTRFRSFGRGDELVCAGSRPSESCVVVSGFAGREIMLKDGGRQIAAVHIAGDFVDLHVVLTRVIDHSVVGLSDGVVAYIPHAELMKISEAAPHLGRLLWLPTIVDGAIHRAWIACFGRRSPLHHLGHLVCELSTRLTAARLISGNSFEFPLKQAQIADVLGLSLVHVNRTIKQLRNTGLVSWKGSVITIHDFTGLAELVDFDPAYLNLTHEPR
ncbi:Crp/Fnr family transcriptional regulator [Bosea sp. BK604]|uniref:Crp/Fnr family transcriptional regulator n=1 Tax=Bosea sp. BK604 TaxID=2512180 RepID=UPI00104E9497|nr:Crp/Fnr family transcriptional regulator [Bosea sp. BK604]TCR64711.1 CRP-like cAMP-binding protein [Bosea sp. BK604]